MIDWFYFPFLQIFVPRQTFHYAVCGRANLLLNWVLYAVTYNFVVAKRFLDISIVVVSPHIAAFVITFPITFFTEFWLQENISFQCSPLRGRTQLFCYLLSFLGSILLNYVGWKCFVEGYPIYSITSQMIISIITIAYSYFMQKYFTFRGCDSY